MRSPAARTHDIRLSAFREDALAPCYGRIKISKTELHKVGLCATRNTRWPQDRNLKHGNPHRQEQAGGARTGRGHLDTGSHPHPSGYKARTSPTKNLKFPPDLLLGPRPGLARWAGHISYGSLAAANYNNVDSGAWRQDQPKCRQRTA